MTDLFRHESLDIGTGPDGKRKQSWATFHGSKKEADNECARLITLQNTGASVEPNRLTVAEYLERWLCDYAATNTAAQTFQRYAIIVNKHLAPGLGKHKLLKLSPLHIQSYYTHALQNGRSNRQGPHRPVPSSTLTAEQAGVLLEASKDTHLQLPILLALATGMRKGEIFGLQWKDVDLNAAILQVRRSVENTPEGPRFKEPKTARGRRVVALPAMAVEAIRHHRIRQNETRLKLGPDYTDLDLLCCLFDGRPVRYNLVRDFQAILKKAGLPKVRFHDLRHTHATLLLTQGVHPKVVSERLGHSNISITLDCYSHVLPGMQKEAASKIDIILQGRAV